MNQRIIGRMLLTALAQPPREGAKPRLNPHLSKEDVAETIAMAVQSLLAETPEATKPTDRKPMDVNGAVFNNHLNNADARARELLRLTAPKLFDRLHDIEEEQEGIMGIFNVTPEAATMLYAGMVCAYVNADRFDLPEGEALQA